MRKHMFVLIDILPPQRYKKDTAHNTATLAFLATYHQARTGRGEPSSRSCAPVHMYRILRLQHRLLLYERRFDADPYASGSAGGWV